MLAHAAGRVWRVTIEDDHESLAEHRLLGGTQSVPGMGTFREVKMRHFMT